MGKSMLTRPNAERSGGSLPASFGEYSARVPLMPAMAAQSGAIVLLVLLPFWVPGTDSGQGRSMAWALLQGDMAAMRGAAAVAHVRQVP